MADKNEGKAFDLTQGKWVDASKPEETETSVIDPPEEKEEEPKEEPKEDPKDEPKEPEYKEEPPKTPDFVSYLKDNYSIESEDQLRQILERNVSMGQELEEAKKPKEYTFKSDRQKKIIDWLDGAGYDLDKIGDGLENAAVLVNLNVEKLDDRKALEEAFIIENKNEISREDAKKLFNKEYKKYTVDKEKFDDEQEYKEEQELIDIQKKKDVAKAKRMLQSEQEKLKATEEKPKEQPDLSVPKDVVDGYSKQVNSIFEDAKGNKKFDRFIYEDEKDPNIKVTVVIPDDKLKTIRQASMDYVKRNDIYDDKKKIPNFDPEAHVKTITHALYGDWLIEQVFNNATNLAKTLRAEQLAGVSPDKKSAAKGQANGIPSIDEQFRELARKEAEARKKRR